MSIIEKYPLLLNNHYININDLYNQAWAKARQAADVLKKSYTAKRVILFGSLLDKNIFDSNSDIDIAVSGIPDRKFYEAVGIIMQVVFPFEVDLVDMNECRESIKRTIESEGVTL